MSATEQLRALAKDNIEVWYATSFDREEDDYMYDALCSLDPGMIKRLGTCEYKIEFVTEDQVFVFYRHLDEM